jgi:hypothetical protein
MTKPDKLSLDDISSRLTKLRIDVREYFGGIQWQPITRQFGIYTMNVPELEAFLSYAEHHFVELERLLETVAKHPNKQPEEHKR